MGPDHLGFAVMPRGTRSTLQHGLLPWSPTGLEGYPVTGFVYYLDRHIVVDGERHGPMPHRFLQSLCAVNPPWQDKIDQVASRVMTDHPDFRDAIVVQLESAAS